MPSLKSTDLDALAKMAAFEETMTADQKRLGWSWQDVKVYTSTIQKLMIAGLVELTYSSNRYKNYMLTDKGHLALKDASTVGVEDGQPQIDVVDLFKEIVGYDETKELLRETLLAKDPIHVLLYGPPSIAKSMFLEDIERATGNQSLPLLGSGTSQSGMWDLIVERRPRFILIDELEKMKAVDQAGLLSLMASRRIIRAKVGRMIEEKIDSRVIAAANVIKRLPPELLSRFWKRPLSEYDSKQYVQVVGSVLVNREGLSDGDAYEIAISLVGKTHDVRDAIMVARLSKRVGVEHAIHLYNS